MPRARSCRLVPLLLLPLLVSVGCSGEKAAQATTQLATTTQPATGTGAATTTQAATTTEGDRQRSVKLRVLSGSGGVFAFLRVYIGGKGPSHSRSTRAPHIPSSTSTSSVGSDLKTIGDPVEVTGITCRGEAARLRMARWRVGHVRLPGSGDPDDRHARSGRRHRDRRPARLGRPQHLRRDHGGLRRGAALSSRPPRNRQAACGAA